MPANGLRILEATTKAISPMDAARSVCLSCFWAAASEAAMRFTSLARAPSSSFSDSSSRYARLPVAICSAAPRMAWIGRNIHFMKNQKVTMSATISARTTPNKTKYITVASRATLT